MLSAGLPSMSLRPNSELKQNPNDIREATTQQRELDMFPELVASDVKPQSDVTKNKMVGLQYLILYIYSYYSITSILFVSFFFRLYTLY